MMKNLIANIHNGLFKVFPTSRLIMIISTPKPTTWIMFPKPWKPLKHLLGSIRFQHDLRGLNRVSFRNVHQKMHMVQSKTKVTKFKTKSLQFTKCLDTSVNVDLLPKIVISVLGDKHHRHPGIAIVTRNLFRATAIYNIHNFYDSYRTVTGQADACRVR